MSTSSVLENQLSDHEPVIVETPYGAFCSFNILCFCTGQNNAFKKTETIPQYIERLKKIAFVLGELQKQYHVVGFLLQEAPDLNAPNEEKRAAREFFAVLQKILPAFNVDPENFCRKTRDTRSCMFAMVDKTVFPEQTQTTPLTPDRYQEFLLQDKSGNKISVMNIHGDHKKPAETAALVCKQIVEVGGIICGDLNVPADSRECDSIREACQKKGAVAKIEKAKLFKSVDVVISAR